MYFIISQRASTRSFTIVKSVGCMSKGILWKDIFELLRPYDRDDWGIIVVPSEGSVWLNKYGQYRDVYGDEIRIGYRDQMVKVTDWIEKENINSDMQLKDYLAMYYNIHCRCSKELFTLGTKLYEYLSKSTDEDCLLIHNLFQKATIPTDELST